ncbi:MAG: hypothetical protein A2015_15020 [Spirochaetes bacterium GWF1_31_7]|nr:MAG: hypothetical protein A2Y30_08745 [Spirochaetes bacterium GWE1_32_154]OHD47133.1 MAG: hypothetical protein A2Y29_06025 [Spirochaetes bacterium GWE2_31_10]OHD48474.1 MAG: hypothetical protein A2015_15020 [Spirochaetes bacterium GWF1_31_7]
MKINISIQQFMKFVLAGILNTSFTYGIYYLLIFIIDYRLSYIISFLSGIILSFILHAKMVFKVKIDLYKIIMYPLVYLTQFSISFIFITLFVENGIVNKKIAPLLVLLITIPITFVISKLILTNRNKNA